MSCDVFRANGDEWKQTRKFDRVDQVNSFRMLLHANPKQM